MWDFFTRLSISKKLVIAMLVSSGAITLISSSFQLYGIYGDGISNIDKRINEIETIHIPDMASRLWISDIDNINAHMVNLVKFQGISAITVYDTSSQLLHHGSPQVSGDREISFSLTYDYKEESVAIGRVVVMVTHSGVYAELTSKAMGILATNALKSFLVGGLILLIFNALVTRHLSYISSHLHNFGFNNLDRKLTLQRKGLKGHNDELDIVVDAVNRMQENISGSIDEINSKNRQLEQDKSRSELTSNLMSLAFDSESELVKHALESSVMLTGSSYGYISLLNEHGDLATHYAFCCSECFSDECLSDMPAAWADTLDGGKSVICNDSSGEVLQGCSSNANMALLNFICLPIVQEQSVVGMVAVANKSGPYNGDDLTQLELYIHSMCNLVVRRRIQSDLDINRQNYHELVESSLAIPWAMDLEEKRFSYIDAGSVGLFGYSLEELTAEGFMAQHIHPDDLVHVQQKYDAITTVGERYSIKYRLLNKDGSERWILDYAKAVPGEGVRPALQGFMFDITEQEQKDLILRRTQKMDAMDRLTGGIAHDYNNMLGIILGYTEMIESRVAGDARLENYVQQVTQAAQRASSLTSRLLQYSKSHETRLENVSLNKLILNNEEMIKKTITPKITLRLDLAGKGDSVFVDENGIEDAILNMCINAMHAMPTGGELVIKTERITLSVPEQRRFEVDGDHFVRLSITDTGIGMDKRTQEKVFDPFFSTKGDGGTGLGLSQVYGLMRRSKGGIDIDSEPGRGTTISLLLPVDESEHSASAGEQGTDEALLHGKERILVVDDEASLCLMAQEILTTNGYSVDIAESGAAALQMLAQSEYDLVISDVIMPKMGGYQLAHEIQRLYPAIKIQLNSGYNDATELDEADAGLHESLLTKPYTAHALLTAVRTLLDSHDA